MPPAVNEGDAELHARRAESVAEDPVGPEKDSVLTSILRNPQIFGRNPPAPACKGREARAERSEVPTERGALESRLKRSWPENSTLIYIIQEI